MSQYNNILFAVLPATYYADSSEELISEWKSCPEDQKWGAPLIEYNARLQVMHKELMKYCKELEKEILKLRVEIRTTDDELMRRTHELNALDRPDD